MTIHIIDISYMTIITITIKVHKSSYKFKCPYKFRNIRTPHWVGGGGGGGGDGPFGPHVIYGSHTGGGH